ncbi:MAG: EF-P lysine aminoacylase EpmA [Wenzhouxiangellaceae bacterium]|nr:EF-P lysine aminoacylase EpmA [Wenzhouxiangellaceae bacterium]
MSTAERIRRRAAAARAVREFFAARGVTEVHTPPVTESGVTDVHIESVALADGRFLRTSPEFAHKRLLAAGAGDLYEFGPVFRAGERGGMHREQFWMIEWYRVGWSWRNLADEAVALVETIASGRKWRTVRIAWRELMQSAAGLALETASDRELAEVADDAPQGLDRPELLDWLFATRVQPHLPEDRITIVYDYPACQAALARLNPADPRFAERFEVFAGPVELANGYRELTDAEEQRRRFEADNRRRAALGRAPMPVDESLLAALERGLPECAGVALGFERLLMVANAAGSIDAVAID